MRTRFGNTVVNGSTLINGGARYLLRDLVNNGTMTFAQGSLNSGSVEEVAGFLTNNGTLILEGSQSFFSDIFPPIGTVSNSDGSSLIKTGAADSVSHIDWKLENDGEIIVEGGTLTVARSILNQGTVDVQGGVLQLLGSANGGGTYQASSREIQFQTDRLGSGNWVVQDQGALTIGTKILNSVDANASLELHGNAVFANEIGGTGTSVAILENKGQFSLKNGAEYQGGGYEFGQLLTNTGEIHVDDSSLLQREVLNRGLISGGGYLRHVHFESGEIRPEGTLTIANIDGTAAGATTLTSGTLAATDLDLTNHTLRLLGESHLQGGAISFGEDAGLEIATGTSVSSPTEISLYRTNLVADGTVNGNLSAIQSQIVGSGTVNGNLGVFQGTSIETDSTFRVNGNLGLSGVIATGTVEVNGIAAVDTASIAAGATLFVSEGTAITSSTFGSTKINGQLNSQVVVNEANLSGDGTINGDVEITDGRFVGSSDFGLTINGALDTHGVVGIQNHDLYVSGLTTIRSGELRIESSGSLFGDGALNIQGGSLSASGTVQKNLFIQGQSILNGTVSGDVTLSDGSSVTSNEGFGLVNCYSDGDALWVAQTFYAESLNIYTGQLNIQIGETSDIDLLTISSQGSGLFSGPDGNYDFNIGSLQLDGMLQDGGGATIVSNGMTGGGTSNGNILFRAAEVFKSLAVPDRAADVARFGLRPGNSPGVLIVSANGADALTISTMPDEIPDWFEGDHLPALFEFEINDANGIAGIDWDLLSVTNGGVTFTGDVGDVFSIELLSLLGDDSQGALAGFDLTQDYTWRFLDTALGFEGLSLSDIQFTVDDGQFASMNGTRRGAFSVIQDSDTSLALHYSFSAVPEPSSLSLFGLLSLGALTFRRKRNGRQAG